LARQRARPPSDAPAAGPRSAALEARLARAAAWASRPAVAAALLALVVAAGVAVRLPAALDEDAYFRNHADEATYFNKAYAEYLADRARVPLAHGGSGLSLLLEQVFRVTGVEPGGYVPQMRPADHALDAGQLEAARLAYVVNALIGGGVVVAVAVLARQVLPPLGALAAAAFAAFDPMLVRTSGHLMTEPLFTLFLALAVAAVLKARRRAAWLLAAGPLMAGAHLLRVNGLVMSVAVAAFAVLVFRRERHGVPWKWLAGAAALFLVVSAPYLAWRSEHLPGPFDYGTNQRFFADNPWDFSDPYWQEYTMKGGGPREGLGDYLREHGLGGFLERLWMSGLLQVADLVGTGATPWTRSDAPALHPLLVVLCAVAAVRLRGREHWAFPLLAAVTVASLGFVYPIVRSPRYFAPLVPFAIVYGLAGLRLLASRSARPWTMAAIPPAILLVLFAVKPGLDGLHALDTLRESGLLALAAGATLLLAALALFAPGAEALGRRLARGGCRGDGGDGSG
jgi:4-amino-4-deoxy-L-arabinose transferase-like glycosyltransferase